MMAYHDHLDDHFPRGGRGVDGRGQRVGLNCCWIEGIDARQLLEGKRRIPEYRGKAVAWPMQETHGYPTTVGLEIRDVLPQATDCHWPVGRGQASGQKRFQGQVKGNVSQSVMKKMGQIPE